MKTMKKLLALLLSVLLLVGAFGIGSAASAEEEEEAAPFFSAKDPENNYDKYLSLISDLGDLGSSSTTLWRDYLKLLREKNNVNTISGEPALTEAEEEQLANWKEQVETLKEQLVLPPGSTFIPSSFFNSSHNPPMGPGRTWAPGSVAWVGLIFEPGVLINEFHSEKYGLGQSYYEAKSAGLTEIDGEPFYFSRFYYGNLGYMVASNVEDDLFVDTPIAVPSVGDNAIGLKNSGVPDFPLVESATAYYPVAGTVYTGSISTIPMRVSPYEVRHFGALENTEIDDELIPIDFVCEYMGQDGTMTEARFVGWRITGFTSKDSTSPYGVKMQCGTELYKEPGLYNYVITLEAEWEINPDNPPPQIPATVTARTWNWLLARLKNLFDLTAQRKGYYSEEDFDTPKEYDDWLTDWDEPIPRSHQIMGGLLAWLLPFAEWLTNVTGWNLFVFLQDDLGLDLPDFLTGG
ncbi:MAG: hypothetical protein FWH26_02100 [Oscillospiraceae bacterium]|nr:hypothetical protein [Oscillospiraceae bacterium]